MTEVDKGRSGGVEDKGMPGICSLCGKKGSVVKQADGRFAIICTSCGRVLTLNLPPPARPKPQSAGVVVTPVKSHGYYKWIWIAIAVVMLGGGFAFFKVHTSAASKQIDLDIASMGDTSSLHLVGDAFVEKGPLKTNFVRAVIANGAQYTFHDVRITIKLSQPDSNSRVPISLGSLEEHIDSIVPGAQRVLRVPIEDAGATDARVVRIRASCDPKAPEPVHDTALVAQPAGPSVVSPSPVPAPPSPGVPPWQIPRSVPAAKNPVASVTPAAPVDPYKDVTEGMTPAQVQALVGPAAKVSKAGVGDQRMEWWTYSDGTKLTFSEGHLTEKKYGAPAAAPPAPRPVPAPFQRPNRGLSP